jgi:hypothetical protein
VVSVVAAAMGCVVLPAMAAFQITYSAIDLPDTDPAQDLWRYDYVLTGHNFAVDDGVEILFPQVLFSELEPQPASGWDIFALSDEVPLHDSSVVAAVRQPLSSPQGFSVHFVWLGGSALVPGSQQFSLFAGGFDDPLSGATNPADESPDPIPEPGSGLLLFAGLFLLGTAFLSRINRRTKASL